MVDLPTPPKESTVYEDKYLYVCLALYPLAEGHTIVVWKKEVPDLRALTCKQYEHLMHVVDIMRNALLKILKIKKVYLAYMDEVKHVHWHLVPRYNEKEFDVFAHIPKKANFTKIFRKMVIILRQQKTRRRSRVGSTHLGALLPSGTFYYVVSDVSHSPQSSSCTLFPSELKKYVSRVSSPLTSCR